MNRRDFLKVAGAMLAALLARVDIRAKARPEEPVAWLDMGDGKRTPLSPWKLDLPARASEPRLYAAEMAKSPALAFEGRWEPDEPMAGDVVYMDGHGEWVLWNGKAAMPMGEVLPNGEIMLYHNSYA